MKKLRRRESHKGQNFRALSRFFCFFFSFCFLLRELLELEDPLLEEPLDRSVRETPLSEEDSRWASAFLFSSSFLFYSFFSWIFFSLHFRLLSSLIFSSFFSFLFFSLLFYSLLYSSLVLSFIVFSFILFSSLFFFTFLSSSLIFSSFVSFSLFSLSSSLFPLLSSLLPLPPSLFLLRCYLARRTAHERLNAWRVLCILYVRRSSGDLSEIFFIVLRSSSWRTLK